MSWRTVVVSKHAKVEMRLNYLVVRTQEETMRVYLSEIAVLIIENTAVSITASLLSELVRRKIKVIFCDAKHNPQMELVPYNGCHDATNKMRIQLAWPIEIKQRVWAELIKEKIRNQAMVLDLFGNEKESQMLLQYVEEVVEGDTTNREGHAAKVYFNTLLGNQSRRDESVVNAALDYGYSILLSLINREIASLGYNLQLGIFHDNTFNFFNLGCDVMEPLRPFVDQLVLSADFNKFDTSEKHLLIQMFDEELTLNGQRKSFILAVGAYVRSVFEAINVNDLDLIRFCEYEF